MLFEDIDEVLALRKHFSNVDPDLILLAFSRRKLGSVSLTRRLRKYGIVKMNYQELEYLGDRVLDLVVSSILFEYYNISLNAMQFNKIQSKFVSNAHLSELAYKIGICGKIIKNPQNEKECADIIEAIFGALYFQGYSIEKIMNWFLSLDAVRNDDILFDPSITKRQEEVIVAPEGVEVELEGMEMVSESEEVEVEPEELKLEPIPVKKIPRQRKKKSGEVIEESTGTIIPLIPIHHSRNFVPFTTTKLTGMGLLYESLNDKYLMMGLLHSYFSFNVVFRLIQHLQNQKKEYRDSKTIDKVIYNFYHKYRTKLNLISVNFTAGRNEDLSKIFSHSKEGWYGMFITLKFYLRYSGDDEISYIGSNDSKIQRSNLSDLSADRSVRSSMKEAMGYDINRNVIPSANLVEYFYYPIKEGIATVRINLTSVVDKKSIFISKEAQFFEEMNMILQTIHKREDPDFSDIDTGDYFEPDWKITKVVSATIPFGGTVGIPEVLMLKGGIVYPLTYDDVYHLVKDVDVDELLDVEYSDDYMKKLLTTIPFAKIGKLDILSRYRMSNTYGAFLKIINEGAIYEINLSFALDIAHTAKDDKETEIISVIVGYIDHYVRNIYRLFKIEVNDSDFDNYYKDENMVPIFNIIYKRLQKPMALKDM